MESDVKVKTKLNIHDILILCAILFSGTDIWAINVGFNIRIIQIVYIFILGAFIIDYKPKLKFKLTYFKVIIFLFFLAGIISTLFAINKFKSLTYLIWIVYTFVILIPMFYLYIINEGIGKIIRILRIVVNILFCLILFQLFLDMILGIELPIFSSQHYMGITRPALWFYEPSYLATYLSIFVAFFAYQVLIKNDKKQLLPLILSIISTGLTTSTTGFLSIGFVLGVLILAKIIMIKDVRMKIIIIVVTLTILLLAILMMRIFFSNVFDKFIMRIFNQGIAGASGARVSDYSRQIAAFKTSPLFGIGLDCYGTFIDVADGQCSNLTLELLATTGIFGCFVFYLIIFSIFYEAFMSKRRKYYIISKYLAFSTLVIVVVLQANQNFMRLYLWMIIALTLGSIFYEKSKALKEQCDLTQDKII